MHPLVYNGVLFSSREVIVGGRKVPYAPLFLCFCVCVHARFHCHRLLETPFHSDNRLDFAIL